MRVVSLKQTRQPEDSPAAVALGFFDGVHLGHRAVIEAAAQTAAKEGLRLAVFTFAHGPKISGGGKQIITNRQKHVQLQALGVDTCYEPPFEGFKDLSPQVFFEEMLVGQYHAKVIFCGDDFAFGAGRKGSAEVLGRFCQQAGIRLHVAPTAYYKNEPISSSRIRSALASGYMEDVNAMLGRPYSIDFPVTHGRKLGSKLGFPTINQIYPPEIITPKLGVYVTQTTAQGIKWPSATGFSTRPTVDDGAPSCETFIPGFTGDLYGGNIQVEFFKRIDDIKKFDSYEQLAASVQGWARQAAEYFAADTL